MAEFGLVRPFDIDGGQLDGLSPQACFVLGYELAIIDAAIESGREWSGAVHTENEHRIQKALVQARIPAAYRLMNDDWAWLQIPARESQ